MRLERDFAIDDPEAQTGGLLDRIAWTLRSYVVFQSDAQVVAASLWVVHTHAFDAAEATPYLAITSPERESGKTRLLEVLELLVARPLRTSNTSIAALFREMEATHPTLLFDEVDAIFGKGKGDHGNEELRGILNSGHRRGATVLRVVGEGKNMHTERFDVFGPKAIAAIDQIPDTIASRSIPIRLQRKLTGQKLKRFRMRKAPKETGPLRADIEAWVQAHRDDLGDEPLLPDELTDRQQDSWEPLLAIADLAGAEWAQMARSASVGLAQDVSGSEATTGVLALTHIREAFGDADQITTKDLLADLVERDDGPWSGWWGKYVRDGEIQTAASKLSRLLKPYEIKSKTIRVDRTTAKGWVRVDFEPVWARYVAKEDVLPPVTPPEPSHRTEASQKQGSDLQCYGVTAVTALGEGARGEPQNGASLLGQKPPPKNTRPCSGCGTVTFAVDELCLKCREERPA